MKIKRSNSEIEGGRSIHHCYAVSLASYFGHALFKSRYEGALGRNPARCNAFGEILTFIAVQYRHVNRDHGLRFTHGNYSNLASTRYWDSPRYVFALNSARRVKFWAMKN